MKDRSSLALPYLPWESNRQGIKFTSGEIVLVVQEAVY
jgi:hypothetical protein